MYYNARSVLPKFDELLLSVDIQRPDVICITESWLCSDIQNSEIAIPGYQTLRLDRNRHGGGILMYVSERFIVKRLPPCPSLELLTVTLHCGNCVRITQFAADICTLIYSSSALPPLSLTLETLPLSLLSLVLETSPDKFATGTFVVVVRCVTEVAAGLLLLPPTVLAEVSIGLKHGSSFQEVWSFTEAHFCSSVTSTFSCA